jgi:hypothetical protein
MRAKLAALCLSVFASAAVCSAQNAAPTGGSTQPDYSFVNCVGFVTDQKVSDEIRLISGEQSNYKVTFARGDYVYINRGQDKGVRVGDRFSVVRHEDDPNSVEWFKSQNKLLKAMGTSYTDFGQVKVVNVQPKVSIGEVTFSCGFMQRGDILRPYEDRPAPPFKDPATFDHFAPVSGKPVGTVVIGSGFVQTIGKHDAVYVNLGSAQGLKVGDYMRVFRNQGRMSQTVPQTEGDQYELYGFGSAGAKYTPKDLPREVLGEGIVLNVSRNSATVLITYNTIEIFPGDYAEIE